jgi:hypothetical protein
MFVFVVFRKSDLSKTRSYFEDLSAYKISWSHADWYNFRIHLRSLNVRHFWKVAAAK